MSIIIKDYFCFFLPRVSLELLYLEKNVQQG